MRLLHVEELRFEESFEDNIPPYAIASHRWGAEEVTLQDIQQGRALSKLGHKKVQGFTKYVKENLNSIKWIWIDTCCIDKTSAAELSESINLMFKWYRNAEICLAYLADVKSVDEPRECIRSEWFRRGWTLQELLAPRVVVFLTNSWQLIGNKGASVHESILSAAGPALEASIAAGTGLPENLLHDFDISKSIPQSEKLKWMEGRDATRKEDLSYALYGILGVYLGANYGEGLRGARDRLIAAVHEREGRERRQAEEFHKIKAWLDPPDPWTNHESARMGRADDTGNWLLQSSLYQDWKDNDTRLLWLYGKAGCGKTILCSTVIEDIRVYCNDQEDVGYATFYCTFSDARKQSLRDLLLSIVAQVCWREPGLSMLQNSRMRPNRSSLSAEELEEILLSTLRTCRIVYLMIDGLDECPYHNDNQRWVLEFLARLLYKASNIHILAASRDKSSIRSLMEASGAAQLPVDTHAVDADIRRYVSAEILRDPNLSRLHSHTKAQIEDTLTQRADGMFRWTFCQLEEVKRLQSWKPKIIEQALSDLPGTLDATYERMLAAIKENVRDDALTLLRWIAYAQMPLTLEELVDTTIIDLTQEASVDIDNRGGLKDALEMLSGLVVTGGPNRGLTASDHFANYVDPDDHDTISFLSRKDDLDTTDEAGGTNALKWNTTVRLAHFSVKEYLESTRIVQGSAQDFRLRNAREHWILAQSCLAYLLFYSRDARKSSSVRDLRTFPLLLYAAETWYVHLSLQSKEVVAREATLFLEEEPKHDWCLVHQVDDKDYIPFCPEEHHEEASALYYASLLGLQLVVQALLDAGAYVNAYGGLFDTALIAATSEGHHTIVQILAKAGADLDLEGFFGNALLEAVGRGDEKIVKTLLEAGARIFAAGEGPDCSNPLNKAMENGEMGIAKMLIEALVDVDSQYLTEPLILASKSGDVEVVQMLINAGADERHLALEHASCNGHQEVVQMLLGQGADLDATAGLLSKVLIAASYEGLTRAVTELIKAGVDVNAEDSDGSNALRSACSRELWFSEPRIVRLLLDAGANVNAEGPKGDSALRWACFCAQGEIVQMLLDAGADVNARGMIEMEEDDWREVNALEVALMEPGGKSRVEIAESILAAGAVFEVPIAERLDEALVTASGAGSEILVRRLIQEGAGANAQRWRPEYWWPLSSKNLALRLAIAYGHEQVVQLLLAAGADVNERGRLSTYYSEHEHHTAIQLALMVGNERIVQLLLGAGADLHDRALTWEDDKGNKYDTALQAEIARGNERIVQILRDAGAEDRSRLTTEEDN